MYNEEEIVMDLLRYDTDSGEGIELFDEGEIPDERVDSELIEANTILYSSSRLSDFIPDLANYIQRNFPGISAEDFTVYTKARYFGWVEDGNLIQIQDVEHIYCELDLGAVDYNNDYIIFIKYIDGDWATIPIDVWDISQDHTHIQMNFYQTGPIAVLYSEG